MSAFKEIYDPSIDGPTPRSSLHRLADHLNSSVETSRCLLPLLYGCFLTGFTSAVSFTACFIWCGFQSGGVAQLGLAVAKTFSPTSDRTTFFQMQDIQALVSLLCFLVGALVGRMGDKMGGKTRKWLMGATGAQVGMMVAAALAALYSGEPSFPISKAHLSWTTPLGLTALGFCSASLGLQGAIGKKLETHLSTSVVLTTTWVELMNDPFLFALSPVPSRDHRVFGILVLFLGAVVGRAVVDLVGSAGALGVTGGLRFLGGVAWVWV